MVRQYEGYSDLKPIDLINNWNKNMLPPRRQTCHEFFSNFPFFFGFAFEVSLFTVQHVSYCTDTEMWPQTFIMAESVNYTVIITLSSPFLRLVFICLNAHCQSIGG